MTILRWQDLRFVSETLLVSRFDHDDTNKGDLGTLMKFKIDLNGMSGRRTEDWFDREGFPISWIRCINDCRVLSELLHRIRKISTNRLHKKRLRGARFQKNGFVEFGNYGRDDSTL